MAYSSAKPQPDLMEKIVSLAKRRGFVFPGSEIYGGLANSWDYGPLGVELKNNIKQLWWDRFVHRRDDMVGIDAALIMNPKVWEKSGHLSHFTDPLVECIHCHNRFRVDKLIEDESGLSVNDAYSNYLHAWYQSLSPRLDEAIIKSKKELLKIQQKLAATKMKFLNRGVDPDKILAQKKKNSLLSYEFKGYNSLDTEVDAYLKLEEGGPEIYFDYLIKNNQLACEVCGKHEFTHPANFNLMLKTFLGPIEDKDNAVYFRPETAQAMFVNFKNIVDTTRKTLPFGVAQIGKAFRNEITPGNFIFRTREFEQMEIEYFIPQPKRDEDWSELFEYWLKEVNGWIVDVGIDRSKVHETEIGDGDRAHYSKRTVDFEFDYPFGKKELYGLAYRTDFDLKNHFKEAPYKDQQTGETFWPHVIEPSLGVDRTLLAVLLSAYTEDDDRVILKLKPKIAPYKAAVFPLLANKPQLVEYARKVYEDLRKKFMVAWDDRGNVGKRYYSQDEIGTPFCITIDFDTLGEEKTELKDTVTVRDRDTGKQERIAVAKLEHYIQSKLA